MMKGAIFDLDGLIIDSEPVWREVEMKVFGRAGLYLTEEMCMQTMGMRINEVIRFWYERKPWKGMTPDEAEEEIISEMEVMIRRKGRPMDGVMEVLDEFGVAGIPMAVASSSCMRLINTALDTLGISGYFEVVHSAEFEENGKPHPAVYLTTAGKMGLEPESCLAFEDSAFGLQAARAAGMKCIAVPAAPFFDDPRFGIADIRLRSLKDFRLKDVNILFR